MTDRPVRDLFAAADERDLRRLKAVVRGAGRGLKRKAHRKLVRMRADLMRVGR